MNIRKICTDASIQPRFLLYVFLDQLFGPGLFLSYPKNIPDLLIGPIRYLIISSDGYSTSYQPSINTKCCSGLSTVFALRFCLDEYTDPYFHLISAWTTIKPRIFFFHLKGISWSTIETQTKT